MYKGFEITILENGYLLDNKKGMRYLQEGNTIVFPTDSLEESARLHIDSIVAEPELSSIEILQAENQELKLAIAELAEVQEANKLELQLALAQIAESLAGGRA